MYQYLHGYWFVPVIMAWADVPVITGFVPVITWLWPVIADYEALYQ